MRLKTSRGPDLKPESGATVFRDVNDEEVLRTIRLVDDDPDSLEVEGDVEAMLAAAKGNVLFRFVQFSAADDLDALVAAYNDGFGRLADALAEAKAIALDRASLTMVSMSIWKDRNRLQKFLDHEDFVPAQSKVMGHLDRPPIAETLRPEPAA